MLFQQDHIFASLVKEITRTIGEQVIFTNENGRIIASTDLARIGSYHEGAELAMKRKTHLHMTSDRAERLEGVRKGVVTPIFIDGKPTGVIGITGEPSEIEMFILIVQRMAELFIQNASKQIAQEKTLRNLELFVFDWINQRTTIAELHTYSDFHQIDLPFYEQVIVLHASSIQSLTTEDMMALQKQWDPKGKAIVIRWGQATILIVDHYLGKAQLHVKIAQFLEAAKSKLGDNITVGVGQKSSYLEIAKSLDQAMLANDIAKKDEQIIFEEDLIFEHVEHEITAGTKEIFMTRTIASIQNSPELLDTLSVWFEHKMRIDQTARALHIHKNTLYYRLDKIQQVTHMDMDDMHHLVLLYMALQFHENKRKP